MLKFLLLAACLVIVTIAAPQSEYHPSPQYDAATQKPAHVVEIIDSGSERKLDGSYSFHFRGEDGSFREETAIMKNPGTENEYLEITGSYSYFDADGKEIVVHYTADNHGFVPEGNNISNEISLAAKQNSELPAYEEDKKLN